MEGGRAPGIHGRHVTSSLKLSVLSCVMTSEASLMTLHHHRAAGERSRHPSLCADYKRLFLRQQAETGDDQSVIIYHDSSLNLETGLFSLDQEKALDLWKLGSGFIIAMITVMWMFESA